MSDTGSRVSGESLPLLSTESNLEASKPPKPPQPEASGPLVPKFTFSTDTQKQIQLLSALSNTGEDLTALLKLLNSLPIFTSNVNDKNLKRLRDVVLTTELLEKRTEAANKRKQAAVAKINMKTVPIKRAYENEQKILLSNALGGIEPPTSTPISTPRQSHDSSLQLEDEAH
jgi:hypothetical protein